MKNSKISKVTPNGSFDSAYGKLFKFEIHFENGDYGDANCKELDQKIWVVGESVWYTLTPNTNTKYNGKLKKEQAPDQTHPVTSESKSHTKFEPKDTNVITMLSCISSACNAVAQSSKGGDKAFILDMAEAFYKAAMSKSAKAEEKPNTIEPVSDLPF